jgi:putative methyltransferase (TIGR04325 family)
VKEQLKSIIPPALWIWLRKRRKRIIWSGHFAQWAEALRVTEGYQDPRIAEKLEASVREVLNGRAAYERDGVLFSQSRPHLPLLAGLLRAQGEPFSVVDFGGGLASAYLQNKEWLRPTDLKWTIIEQPALVEAGRRLFPNGPPFFLAEIEMLRKEGAPIFLILSCSLQYFASPDETLAGLLSALKPKWVFFDRVSYWPGPGHRLTVQKAPEKLSSSSYPCWFFDKQILEAHLRDYVKLFEYPTEIECLDFKSSFEGSFWELRKK